jgi:tRNA dimethylallyltransferase
MGRKRKGGPTDGPSGESGSGVAASFLAIIGPTGVGKTSLSLAVASVLEVEIISMDSRQIYRGMDVGTGKATAEDRARVPHFGLDLRDPNERYSAGQFSRDARGWMEEIRGRGRIPLLVGGTGFFLKALTDPMFSQPPIDRERLQRLRGFLNRLSPLELRRYVGTLDPEREALAGAGGRQRSTRTVEMALLTGRSLSWWHREGRPSEEPLKGVVTVLDLPRPVLYDRINRRVERMVGEGLVEEVRELLAAGFGPGDPGMTGAGYREVLSYLQGSLTLEEAVAAVQRSHRRYARRQITWNRHQLPQEAIFLDGTLPQSVLVEEVLGAWGARVQ